MKKLIYIIILLICLTGCKNEGSINDKTNDIDENDSIPSEEIVEYGNEFAKIIAENRSQKENKIYQIVTNKNDSMAQAVFDILGIRSEDMETYAISISPMNLEAYCVAIIRPQDEKEQNIKNALYSYKEKQVRFYENYLNEQYKIARRSIIMTVNKNIIFVMSEDSNSLIKRIQISLEKVLE